MKFSIRARVLAAGLVAGALMLPLGSAHAAPDSADARSNSRWLAEQLVDGRFPHPFNPELSDYGLMIDALYAGAASGDLGRVQSIVDVLDDQGGAEEFYHLEVPEFDCDGEPATTGDHYSAFTGGAIAKSVLAAQVAGRDPRAFGGEDVVALLDSAISTDPKSVGKLRDYTDQPACKDFVSDNANTFGQVLAVIAYAGLGENNQAVLDRLLTQQCSEGYFRVFYYAHDDGTLNTCDEGKAEEGQSPADGDTTGFALSGLLAAKKAGATGLDTAIGEARDWLVANQTPSGGWIGTAGVTPDPNTNSTGLVVQALAEAGGAASAVAAGAAFIASAQANVAADSANALSTQIGAIAYKPSDYQDARTGGIAGIDTWIRAGAQASLGLSRTPFSSLMAGPAAKVFPVTTAVRPVARGAVVPVTASGLGSLERYRVLLGGVVLASGTASETGTVSRTVTVPSNLTSATRTLRVVGWTAKRAGQAKLVTAAPKTLSVAVAKRPLALGKRQTVTVSGLLPGERVSVSVTGQATRLGFADSAGRFRTTFAAHAGAGTKKARACGVTCTRQGATTYRVVR